MKKTKFTESQISGILKEQDQGKSVLDICLAHGISQPTFYAWKSKYSGLEVHHVKRMKELDPEAAFPTFQQDNNNKWENLFLNATN